MNDINHDVKIKHDLASAIRFLEQLHTEIKCAEKLDDIKDELILEKLLTHIECIKNELAFKSYPRRSPKCLF